MTDTPTPVPVEKTENSLFANLSVVWIIPLFALVMALAVAWKSYTERGPLITIEFESGAGIAPRETDVRFRDVKVGIVEEVQFSPGLASVVAHVRLEKEVAPYVDAGASFWIVRPELTARGVSGLDTVLSGVFIEGSWDSEIGPERTIFRGLEAEPPVDRGSR